MSMLKSPTASPRSPERARPRTRRLVAFLVLVAACWVTLFALVPSPGGEPVLRSTSPGNGENVKSPDQVVLTFDRPVPAGLATVRILQPNGAQIVSERPVHPAGHADEIAVPMPEQRYEGTYAAAWTLPSHGLEPIGGTFTFNVYAPITPDGLPEIETVHDPVVAVFHTAARFAAVAALALLAGAAFFVAAIWPAGAERKSVRRLVISAWAGLLTSTLAVIASFGPYAAWAPLSAAFDPRLISGTFQSDAGGALLARLCVLIPASLGLLQLMTAPGAETTRERWWRGGTVLGCTAAVAATWSLPTGPSPLALAVDIVLMTTIAVAFGGLVMMLLYRGKDPLVIPRFTRVAAVCVGLLVVAGGYLAVRHGFAATSYGWLVAGIAAFVALLGVTYPLLSPRRVAEGNVSRHRLPVASLTGISTLILATTAILVVTQAPRSAHAREPAHIPLSIQQQEPPSRVEFDTGSPNGQGSLDFVLIPTHAGPNQVDVALHISVFDSHNSIADGISANAVFNRPDHTAQPIPVVLNRAAPGYSTGSAIIPSHGRWQLALTIRATDGSQQTLAQDIDVT